MSNFAFDYGCYYSQPSFSQPYSPRKRIRSGEGFGSDPGNGLPDMNFHPGQGTSSFVPNTINIHNAYCALESESSTFPNSAEVHGWARRNLAAPQDNSRRGPMVHERNDFPRDSVQFLNHMEKNSGQNTASASTHNGSSFQDLSTAVQSSCESRNQRNEIITRHTEIDLLGVSDDVMTYSEYREREQTYPEIDHDASNREIILSYDASLSRCYESVEIIRQACGSHSSKFDFFCAKLQEALEALDRLGNPSPYPEIDARLSSCHSDHGSCQAEIAAASFCGGNKFLSSLETSILPLVSVALKADERSGSIVNEAKQCLAESLPRHLQLKKRVSELWAPSDHASKLLSHYSCDGAVKASESYARYLHYRDRQEEKIKNPNRKWQQVKNDTALSLADNNLDCEELHDNILWQAYRNMASVNQPQITELMPAVSDSTCNIDGKAAAIHYRDLLYEERALKLRLEALEKDISSKNRRLEHHQRCLRASLVLTSGGSSSEDVTDCARPSDTLQEQANISGEIRLLKAALSFSNKAPLSILRELLESSLKAVDLETHRQQEHSKDESYLQSQLIAIAESTSPKSLKMSEQMRKEHRIFLEKEIIAIEQQRALCAETCRFLLYFAEHLSLQMFEGGTGFSSQAESDNAKAKCHLLHCKANSLLSQVSKSEPKKPSDDDMPNRSLVIYDYSNQSEASSSLQPEAVVFRRCIECSRRISACLDRSEHILPDGTVLSEVEARAAQGYTQLNPSILRMVVSGLAMLRQPNGPCHKTPTQRAHAEMRPRKVLHNSPQDSSDAPRLPWENGLQLACVLSEAIDWVLSGRYVSATVFYNPPGLKAQGEKRKHRNQELILGPSSLEMSTGAAFHIAASHMRVRYPWARRLAVADLRSMVSASSEGDRSGYGLILPLTGAGALDQQTLVVGVPDRSREHSSGSNLEEWARRFRSSIFEPIGAFGPDLIVVFFDAFSSVPCGGSSCSRSDRPSLLGWTCSALSELARSACRGRVIFVRAGEEGLSGPIRPTLHGLRQVIGAATGLTEGVPKLLLAPPGTNVIGSSWSEGLEGGESDEPVQDTGRPSINGRSSPDPVDRPAPEKKGKGRIAASGMMADGGGPAESGDAAGQRKPRIEGAPTLKPREAVLRVLSGRPEGMEVSELVEAVQLLPCNIDVKEGVNLRSSITHMLSVCSSGGPHSRSANHAAPPTAPERPRLFEKVWPGAPGSGTVRFRISKAWQSQD